MGNIANSFLVSFVFSTKHSSWLNSALKGRSILCEELPSPVFYSCFLYSACIHYLIMPAGLTLFSLPACAGEKEKKTSAVQLEFMKLGGHCFPLRASEICCDRVSLAVGSLGDA